MTTQPVSLRAVEPPAPAMSVAMSRFIRWSAIASALVIAACAVVLSYSGLHTLALQSGVDRRLAFVWPVMVDGLQLVGSLGVMYSTLNRISTKFPWFVMLLGVGISVSGNVAAAPVGVTSRLLHAAAPLILALVLEELMRVARHKVSLSHRAVAPVPVAARDSRHPVPVPDAASPATPVAARSRVAAPKPSGTRKEAIEGYVRDHPGVNPPEVYRALGTDPKYTRTVMRELARTRPVQATD